MEEIATKSEVIIFPLFLNNVLLVRDNATIRKEKNVNIAGIFQIGKYDEKSNN